MKAIDYVLLLSLALIVLVGCGQVQEIQVESAPSSGQSSEVPPGVQGAASVTQLALGTLKLEDTENAVTPTQAADLLPLWRMIAGGSLKSDTETNAVLKQIEGEMSGPQLAAIKAMELVGGDVQAWMQEQGIRIPAPPEGRGSSNGPGALQNLSEEDRAKMREEFQGMSAKERATRMASLSAEARGVGRPDGGAGARPGGGLGPTNVLFDYLVKYLTKCAAG
jgi:hypothetical protein